MRKYGTVALLAGLCLTYAGCTWTWIPTARVPVPEDQEKLPLSVGLFIPPSLEALEHGTPTDAALGGAMQKTKNHIKVGVASADLFRQGLPRLFERVQLVAKDAPDDRYPVVLVPAISTVSAEVSGLTRSASLEYMVEIIDRTGARSSVRSGKGEGTHYGNFLIRLIMLPVRLAAIFLTLDGYDQTSMDFQDAFSQAQTKAFLQLSERLRSVPAVVRAVNEVRAQREMAQLAPSQASLDDQLAALTTQLLQGLGTAPSRRIAVAGFIPGSGEPTQFHTYLAEEFVTRLVMAKPHTVVERSLLDKALAELKLNQTDLVDPKHAKALGKVTGADAVLVGSTTDMGQQVRITARIVETETGTVLAVGSIAVFQHQEVKQLMGRKVGSPTR